MIKDGINLNTGESYEEYVEKFKEKHTTDDTFTPPYIMAIVEDYVSKTYNKDKKNFVRPFWPGADYKAEKYEPGDIVVDNPPFSILADIIRFYTDAGVSFFLFCPALTAFSSPSDLASVLCLGVDIIYDNEANVKTSFITNLEDCRCRTAPDLYERIIKATKAHKIPKRGTALKYDYPAELITAARIDRLSKYGVKFSVDKSESEKIKRLEQQKKSKKAIFGSGYLISKEKAEEFKKANEKADKQKIFQEMARTKLNILTWELSEEEKEIVKNLSKQKAREKAREKRAERKAKETYEKIKNLIILFDEKKK